jgi:hypothetical protein
MVGNPSANKLAEKPLEIQEAIRKTKSLHAILSASLKRQRVSRLTLKILIGLYGEDTIRQIGGDAWFDCVTNEAILWDFIETVTPIPGKHTAWDLTVPDGCTFMMANQLVVYDTMMVHVPVGDKAVDETKLMTLSNMLYGDKSKNDLLVFPQHEAIMGLAHATATDDKNVVKKFKNKQEAMQAYREGKIGLGTRVKIGE